jgi:hypothetical protein
MTDEAPQQPAMQGEGNQPEGTGYAPPDTGAGDSAESEIPIGVDAIEAKDPPADDAEGGSAAIDLANLDTGDADAAAGDEADASADAEAAADAEGGDEAEASGDADAQAAADAEGEASEES